MNWSTGCTGWVLCSSKLFPPVQNIGCSRYIVFTMYLDIVYMTMYSKSYVPRKAPMTWDRGSNVLWAVLGKNLVFAWGPFLFCYVCNCSGMLWCFMHCVHMRNYKYVWFILLYIILDLVAMFSSKVSIHAANPVGAVSEFIAQLQILELLDNVSNHASWIILQKN